MDTEKLVRVVADILKDEDAISIAKVIEDIKTSSTQNNTEGFNAANSQLNELSKLLTEKSISFTFSRTEQEILERLQGDRFFGQGLINRLGEILRLPSYNVLTVIDQFKTERDEFIARARKLSSSFAEMEIPAWRPGEFEIGIVLPSEQGDATDVSKKIHEFELLIKSVQELTGSATKQVQITRVSNGSLEFFTSQPMEVVDVVSTILVNMTLIWDRVTSLRNKQTSVQDDSYISAESKKKIKKALEEDVLLVKKDIEDTLPDQIMEKASPTLDQGRKNEIRNNIRAKLKVVIAWFELGIEVDIVPVRLESTNTDPEQVVRQTEVLTAINTTNQLLKKVVYALPPESRKLPFRIEAPETPAVEPVVENIQSEQEIINDVREETPAPVSEEEDVAPEEPEQAA